jgi:hypothetical protein
MNKKVLVAVLIVIIIVAAAGAVVVSGVANGDGKDKVIGIHKEIRLGKYNGVLDPAKDRTEEGAKTEIPLSFNDSVSVTEVTVSLSWSDDMPNSKPDFFKLYLLDPEGNQLDTEGQQSPLVLTLITGASTHNVVNNTAGWKVIVECKDAGDENLGPLGLFVKVDDGNDWQLSGSYKSLVEK